MNSRLIRPIRDFRKEALDHFKTKTAAKSLLSENTATWGSELLALLYKQHPWLGTYQVNLQVEGTDDSRGYQYGLFMVSPHQDQPSPMGAPRGGNEMVSPAQQPQQPDPAEIIRIPVIVEANKVFPFDLCILPSGEFTICSETRVSAALFDSSTFAPVDPAVVQAGAKPGSNDSAGGFGADVPGDAYTGRSGPDGAMGYIGKRASVDLNALGISQEQVTAFLTKVANDEHLAHQARHEDTFKQAVVKIGHIEAPKTKQASINPDVVGVHKINGGYEVMQLQADGLAFRADRVGNEEANFSPKVKQAAINGELVLVTKNTETLLEVNTDDTAEVITKTASAILTNRHGSNCRGLVLSGVNTLQGETTDSFIVIGEHGSTYQPRVAGFQVKEASPDLTKIASDFRGEGFLHIDDTVYEPIEISNVVSWGDKVVYHADHPIDGRVLLEKTARVQKLVQAGPNRYLIPERARFSQLSGQMKYMSDPTGMSKIASRHDHLNTVKLSHEENGFFKLAGRNVEGLSDLHLVTEHAVMAVCALGDTAEGAKEKVAKASEEGLVRFIAKNKITSVKEKVASPGALTQVVAKAIQVDLVKEASVLGQSDSVDAVLSLGFITPENIDGYIDSVPELEEALSRLCELLLGVRLGLSEVPEKAVSSAVQGLDKAITGLKKLQIRQGTEAAIE